MFCRICGKKLPDDSRFCMYCGEKVIKVAESAKTEEKPEPIKEKPSNSGTRVAYMTKDGNMIWVPVESLDKIIERENSPERKPTKEEEEKAKELEELALRMFREKY